MENQERPPNFLWMSACHPLDSLEEKEWFKEPSGTINNKEHFGAVAYICYSALGRQVEEDCHKFQASQVYR